MVILCYDGIDQSNYDYVGDYKKTLQSAVLEEALIANDSIYDSAYVRKFPEYSLYYLIDIDDKIIRYFSTNDTSAWVGTFTGDLSSGIKIHYDYDGGINETLKFKNAGDDTIAVLIDSNGFDWEYKKVDISEAEAAFDQIGRKDMMPTTVQTEKEADKANQSEKSVKDKKRELTIYQAKKAFEYYGSHLYPYGFECHWFTKLYEDTQFDDGSWKLKVGVTVTNQYGASVEATAEAFINNTTQRVEDFDVYVE